MFRLLFILIFSSLIVGAPAQQAKELQGALETVYGQWRQAMVKKNYEGWKEVTAYARQIETRNLVVSQKQRFPAAIFALPMKPPTLDGLRLLHVKTKGPTGVAVYFGKADLAVEAAAPESLLVLRYLKEGTQWKFYRLALMGQLPQQALDDIQANRLGFLSDAAFQPSGQPPKVQQPCDNPDYVSDIHLITYGFDTTVTINGISTHEAGDTHGTQLVIGGLKKGKNSIQITSKPLGKSESSQKNLKVTVHVKTGNKKKPAVQVFEFKPDPSKGPFTFTGEITVDKAALSGR